MCGFAGYRLAQPGFQCDNALLELLSQTISHRGPDDAGTWVSQDHTIALVARRLSIIDISSAGAQPMMDAQQKIVLVFNGEIYNYRELRAQLQEYGHQFKSHTDTEVVVYAYKQWGIACLEKLDGMFAFSLYDRETEKMYLVRDRMGIKPLYFSTQGNAISFASEIKALWHLPWMKKNISLRSVSHYLTHLAAPAPSTLFQEVYKLPAGFYACVGRDGSIQFTEWYDVLQKPTEDRDYDEWEYQRRTFCSSKIRTLLRNAVHKRLIADVPVGALLSGGLDSSLIVAFMAEQHTNLKTFNVSFADDPNGDERAWARKVAKRFGTDHHELILSEQEAFGFFQKMAYHQDEPIGDSVCIPFYFVSKLARDAGVKVVLVGEGSDELFCGYPLYVDYIALNRYWNATQQYIPAAVKRGLFYAARPMYSQYPNRQDLMKSWAEGRDLFWGSVRVFSPLWKHEVMHATINEPADPIVEKVYPGFPQEGDSYDIADFYRARCYQRYPKADFLSMTAYLELKHRLPELILMRTDKMTMAASIEGRVPFLDRTVVEFMMRVPMKFKYANGQTKYILKKVAESMLPRDIIYRQKVGFSTPLTRWFKHGTYFRQHLMDTIHSNNQWREIFNSHEIDRMIRSNPRSSVDYSYQLWALENVMAFGDTETSL